MAQKPLAPELREYILQQLRFRSARLSKLIGLNAPDVIIEYESRMTFNALLALYGTEELFTWSPLDIYRADLRKGFREQMTSELLHQEEEVDSTEERNSPENSNNNGKER